MLKWAIYGALGLAIILGWVAFITSGHGKKEDLRAKMERIEEMGSLEELETIPSLKEEIRNVDDSKTLTGILMALLTAGLVGIIFVIDVLPVLAHKVTHAVYDSGEEVEEDVMHDARAKLAQGDYEGAIGAFRDAAVADPQNRLPWVEIARVQRDYLKEPQAAVATLRQAVEGQEWAVNDAAFLMFRLAEIYDEDMGDRGSAATLMQQVVEQFPETRHSANARHKLHEWGLA